MGTTPAWWRPHAQPSPLCTGSPSGRGCKQRLGSGAGDGGPADTACAPASGEGAWFLLHENKGIARYSFFYPIQRKNKNYDVYRSLNF